MRQGNILVWNRRPQFKFWPPGGVFSENFTSGVRFLPKLSPRGVFFPKFSPRGGGVFEFFQQKVDQVEKNLNFSTHFGYKRAFFGGKIVKNWLFLHSLTKFDKFSIFGKIKKFWLPSWRLCGPETKFCKKYQNFG